MGNGRQMNEKVRRSAEGRHHHHGVPDGCGRKDVTCAEAKIIEAQHSAGRTVCGVKPDRLSGGRKSRMRQRESQRFADYLCCCRGAEKLAPTAWRRAGTAAHFGSMLKRDLVVCETRADGLYLPRILTGLWQKRHAARYQNRGLLA